MNNRNFVKVTGHTKAKIRGTLIYCPVCKKRKKIFVPIRVYNFYWSNQLCLYHGLIDKKDWLIEEKDN